MHTAGLRKVGIIIESQNSLSRNGKSTVTGGTDDVADTDPRECEPIEGISLHVYCASFASIVSRRHCLLQSVRPTQDVHQCACAQRTSPSQTNIHRPCPGPFLKCQPYTNRLPVRPFCLNPLLRSVCPKLMGTHNFRRSFPTMLGPAGAVILNEPVKTMYNTSTNLYPPMHRPNTGRHCT